MDEYIQITKDYRLQLEDFSRIVDFDVPFTLRDVINLVVLFNDIPLEVMERLIECPYLFEYMEEAQNPPSKEAWEDPSPIEFLQLSWFGDMGCNDGKKWSNSSWQFDGIGFKGVMSDAELFGVKEVEPNFREKYGIEFSTMNNIADLVITLNPEMMIIDHESIQPKSAEEGIQRISFTPSITMGEMLHAIFWELSFMGSPANRDSKKSVLEERCNEIKEASANGTLDQLCVPWEKVKADLEEKFGFKTEGEKNDIQN